MATIVPLSHSLRWRSRSRGSSMDLVDASAVSSSSSPRFVDEHHDHEDHAFEWNEEPSDDEDAEFDEPQSAAWLVVPRAYANPSVATGSRRRRYDAPVSPHSTGVFQHNSYHHAAKSMERRRADESAQ